MSAVFDPNIFQRPVFQGRLRGLFDEGIFQPDVFQGENHVRLFQRGVFQSNVFQDLGREGFRFRNKFLPRYLDTLDEDEEEAIFLMSASEIFGA